MERGLAKVRAVDGVMLGVTFIVLSYALVPMMDGIAKYLSADYPVGQIVWARYFFHLAVLLPLVLLRHGGRALLPARPWAQVLRGALLLGSTILFFTAIAEMPIADALALVFVSPLVVTALSPLVLGERVGLRRGSAVVVGFLGALVIIRPGFGVLQPAALLALGAGCLYGSYLLATRRLAGAAPPLVTLTYTALIGAIVMSLWVPFVWQPPSLGAWAWMIAMGSLAASGHFLLIKAFEHAPATILAPFTYVEIIAATVVGYFAFGDFPDAWTWIGITIIAGSGLYILLRERKVKPGRPPSDDGPTTVVQA
jgi:drug/metabolite transporter (DMT)-like permease